MTWIACECSARPPYLLAAEVKKSEKEFNAIFRSVMTKGHEVADCAAASLWIVDYNKEELWTRAMSGNQKSNLAGGGVQNKHSTDVCVLTNRARASSGSMSIHPGGTCKSCSAPISVRVLAFGDPPAR